jgi:RNA polymerase sigma-70 factor (ECF subfamily)
VSARIDGTSADETLVERLRAGEESAVDELAARYSSRIRQLALRHVKSPEDADEVVQDVLLKVYQKIEAFRGDSALSSWIYRITFNTAMSRLRSLRNDRTRSALPVTPGGASEPLTEGIVRDIPDWSSLADDGIMRAQLRRKLMDALVELPPIYRVPVLLRDVQGLSTEEASAALRVKDQTLKSRLHRGRMFLRSRLADFADGVSLHRPATLTVN